MQRTERVRKYASTPIKYTLETAERLPQKSGYEIDPLGERILQEMEDMISGELYEYKTGSEDEAARLYARINYYRRSYPEFQRWRVKKRGLSVFVVTSL